MDNKPITVEPVLCSDRQRDVSSNHAEIQMSRRRKAQDTVQFQSADANHDLEESLQNLEVVEHVEGRSADANHDLEESLQNLEVVEHVEGRSADANHDLEESLQNLEVVEHVEGRTTENNHDQREESQNLHENNGQEIGATGGYSAFSRVQPEEADDLQFLEMITEKEDTDGMFNTCTIDTILTIMAVLQLKIGKIHDFFKNSNHRIYKANSKLPQLLRDKRISDMRRLIDFGKRLDSRDYADDINNLLQQYVIKEEFVTDCAKCGFRRWDDVKEVVNCKDYRAKDTNCIPDQMHENPAKFFRERLRYYLNFFFLHNNSSTGETAYCQNCRSKRKITYTVEGSDGNPSPLFIVMLPIDGTTESGNVIWEDVVKDISPLCCFNYEYVVGAVIVFIENPCGSETSSNYSESSDNQEEQRPGIIADTDDELLGHYIGHIYIFNPESAEIIKKYNYCNSKGIKVVREFENKGHCVTFLLFRTK